MARAVGWRAGPATVQLYRSRRAGVRAARNVYARGVSSAEPAPSSADHIRDVALSRFAVQGTAGTSLREIAAAAGVSLGRVQHHFRTKAGLIRAVDEHVLTVMRGSMPDPLAPPSEDTVGDFGDRVVELYTNFPNIITYVARSLVDGDEIGLAAFDNLVTRGKARWANLAQRDMTRPDLDLDWAALNPIILALGAIILQGQIERHLPGPFTSPEQLRRWEQAVSSLLRQGQLKHEGPRE